MRKNIFIKSILRQPIRSLLLTLLLGVASFFLVSRVVEYQIVTTETERIGGFYRSIGYFCGRDSDLDRETRHPDGPIIEGWVRRWEGDHGAGDIAGGAKLILESPYFDYPVLTRRMFGVLDGVQNASISGSDYTWFWINQMESEEDITANYAFNNDAYFYFIPSRSFGPLLGTSNELVFWHNYEFFRAIGYIDVVEMGYPEHVREGVEVEIRWRVEDGATAEMAREMEVGQRYFIRASHHFRTDLAIHSLTPEGEAPLYLKALNEDGLYFWPVPMDEVVDFTHPELAHLPGILEILDENQRTMSVAATVDMSAMPVTQEVSDMWYLREGRWLNLDDYENENHVAVVHWLFASMRDLSIGDSITLTFRDMQTPDGSWIGWGEGIPFCFENWRDLPTYEATFEIVGLFDRSRWWPANDIEMKDVFVPASIIPEEMGFEFNIFSYHHYSFVLTSTRHQDAFISEYQEALAQLGITLGFIEHGAQRFWEAANPILQSLTFNMRLFSGAFLFIVLFIAFLYLQQRRREFAILRGLGCPKIRGVYQLSTPVFLIWLPVIFGGCIAGWFFAHDAATQTLATIGGLGDYMPEHTSLSLTWLVSLSVIAFVIPFLLVLVGALRLTQRPVLEMLQGTTVRASGKRKDKDREKEKARENESKIEKRPTDLAENIVVTSDLPQREFTPLTPLATTKAGAKRAFRQNILRHILRTPAKAFFTIGIALLLLLAVGWLQEAIERGDKEIDHLYDTTVVTGHLRREFVDGSCRYGMGQVFYSRAVDPLLDTGFVQNVYLEAGFNQMHIVAPNPDGSFPYEIWEDEAILTLFNRTGLHGTSDIEVFKEENGFEIIYADGFDESIFSPDSSYDFQAMIPVILSEETMIEKNLSLGDLAFISHNFRHLDSWTFPIQVVGMYTESTYTYRFFHLGIIPMDAIETIRSLLAPFDRMASYITVRFEVNPAYNRQMDEFREELERIVARPQASWTPITFDLFDGELVFVVRQMEQNLQLLRLLYPVVIAVSMLIGIGLYILLMLQHAKRVAVMRVLGMSRRKIRQMLTIEQGLITLVGLVFGTIIFAFLGSNTSLNVPIVAFATGYFIATIVGSLIGAIMVSNRPALELLQVKE